MNKTALLVAYAFPPRSVAGVYRPLQFARYLPQQGWTPHVLTASMYPHEKPDESLLLDEVERQVTRTGRVPIDYIEALMRNGAKRVLRGWYRSGQSSESSGRSAASGDNDEESDRGPSVLHQIVGRLQNFSPYPDRWVGWVPFAVRAGRRLIEEHDVDVLFSTFKPVSSHLVAWALKREFDLPWVADFRDPWTYNPYRDDTGSLRWQADRWLQTAVMDDADAVVSVTEPWTRMMADKFGDRIGPTEFRTIMNGFDAEEYAKSPYEKDEVFELVYTGIFYRGKRDPSQVFRAAGELIREGVIDPQHFKISIAGRQGDAITGLVDTYGVEEVVDFLGHIPHEEAVELQQKSSALLMIQSDINEGGCPGKVFEYLGARRPILALANEGGVVSNILRETSSGVVIPPSDYPEIKRTLREWYESYHGEAGEIPVQPDGTAIEQYSRQNRTRELAELFDDAIERW